MRPSSSKSTASPKPQLAVASSSAAIWASYGVFETLFVASTPLVRQLLSPGPAPIPGQGPDLRNAILPAVLLILYPIAGAFFGFLAGLIIRPPGDARTFGSKAGAVTLTIVFEVNAVLRTSTFVAAAVILPLIYALSAWVPRLNQWRERSAGSTDVVAVPLLLIGSQFLAQPRFSTSSLVRNAVVCGYVVTLFLLQVLARSVSDRRSGTIPARSYLLTAAIAVLAFTTMPVPARRTTHFRRKAAGKPNVLLITLDTVRADHMSVYGYPRDTTPRLTQWSLCCATAYTNAVSSSNWTRPSHASIFTGQYPSVHGARDAVDVVRIRGRLYPAFSHPISSNSVMLPEMLSRAGYLTAGIVANYGILSGPFGFERGFAYYDYLKPAGFFEPRATAYLLRPSIQDAMAALIHRVDSYAHADTVNGHSRRFLQYAGPRQPFFLFLNYMDAHAPYQPPHPYDAFYPGKDASFDWRAYDALTVSTVALQRPLNAREYRHLVSQYDGSIRYLDEQLDRLFTMLKELRLYDNTLIIVTADHGESFGESDVLGHGRSLYQHQVHVPLIIKMPYAAAGARLDDVAGGVDLLPTVLDVACIPLPPAVEGRSLVRRTGASDWWTSSESYRPRDKGFGSTNGGPAEIAVFHGSLKQIIGGTGGMELYDLSKDPHELRDLYGHITMPDGWQSIVARAEQQARAHPPDVVTDPEVLRQLRALGYLR